MESRFYVCRHCDNLVGVIHDSGVPLMCCGTEMDELIPNTTEAAGEKHLPVAVREGDNLKVTVGSVNHPMTAPHFIQWVYLLTDRGGQRKILTPDDEPSVTFALGGDKPIAVYAYCNLHGLWAAKL